MPLRLTIEALALAGVSDFIIAATPRVAAEQQQALGGGSDVGVKISHVLIDESESVAQAIVRADEFLSNYATVVAAAGLHGAEERFADELNRAISASTGVTVFVERGAARFVDGLLVLHSRSRFVARQAVELHGTSAGFAELIEVGQTGGSFVAKSLECAVSVAEADG